MKGAHRFHVARGVTRCVVVGHRWAFKFPRLSMHFGVRGWLANRSEWRRRNIEGINRPLLNVGNFCVIFQAADEVRDGGVGPWEGQPGDYAKPHNWGLFGDEWRLLDYEQCWKDRGGIIARIYWWNSDRIGRRWIALAEAQGEAA